MKFGPTANWRQIFSGWLWALRTNRPNFVAAALASRSDRSLQRFEVLLRTVITLLVFSVMFAVGSPEGPLIGIFREVGLTMLVAIPGLLVVAYVQIHVRSEIKGRRDRKAVEVLKAVTAGQKTDFFLFLRSFESDARLLLEDSPFQNPIKYIFSQFDFQSGDPIDRAIVNGLSNASPLVKLGNQEEAMDFDIGTIGYVTGDPQWYVDFEKLAHSARKVFIVPIAQKGSDLMKEIAWLHTHDLQDKVLLLMPPNLRVKLKKADGTVRKERRVAHLWSDSSEVMESTVGYALPAYRATGGIVLWDGDEYKLATAEYGAGWTRRAVLEKAVSGGLTAYNRTRTARYIAKQTLRLDPIPIASIGLATFWDAFLFQGSADEFPPLVAFLCLGAIGYYLWKLVSLGLQLFRGWRACAFLVLSLLAPLLAMTASSLFTKTTVWLIGSANHADVLFLALLVPFLAFFRYFSCFCLTFRE